MKLDPYIHFNGNCEEAFKFYVDCLGANIEALMKYTGSPAEKQVPAEWTDKILHARLTIGEQVLMASDAPPGRYSKPQGFSLSVTVNDPADAERIFGELANRGSIQMPMEQTFWAKRFGMCTDRFGIPWMVNCE